MSNNSMCTVVGFVASAPLAADSRNGTRWASFRVGTTDRYWDRKSEEWTDGQKSFFTVKCRRALARHVESSLRKGDPVIAYGRLRIDEWTADDGSQRTTTVIEAVSIGHDLVRGTSMFLRSKGQSTGDGSSDTDVQAALVRQVAGEPVSELSPDDTTNFGNGFGTGVEPDGPPAVGAVPDPGDEQSPPWDPLSSADAESRAV